MLQIATFAGWAFVNSGKIAQITPFDPFPYPLLSSITSLEAVLIVAFVLMKQNRMGIIAVSRDHLDVQDLNKPLEKEVPSTTMKNKSRYACFAERSTVLNQYRNLKMASSSHAYVRAATRSNFTNGLPRRTAAGFCHLGNLGPLADTGGKIAVQIRDLDQSVIGNLAHDLIRLGLSLAKCAVSWSGRRSARPTVRTVMDEDQKLRRDLERYRALLYLTSDQRAVTTLDELIKETLDRLNQIKHQFNGQAAKLDQ